MACSIRRVQPVADWHTQQSCKCGLAKICSWDLFSGGFSDSSVQFSNMNSVLTMQCRHVRRSDHLTCWRVTPFGANDSQRSITGETCQPGGEPGPKENNPYLPITRADSTSSKSEVLMWIDSNELNIRTFYLSVCVLYVHVCLYMHMTGSWESSGPGPRCMFGGERSLFSHLVRDWTQRTRFAQQVPHTEPALWLRNILILFLLSLSLR